MTRPVRFRSSDRDRRTDIERLRPLRHHINEVLAAIDRESDGVSRRLEEARNRAAGLMGTETGIYFEREPAAEAGLVEAETQMMEAYRRLDQLRAQRAMIAAWRNEIDGTGLGPALRAPDRSLRPLERLRRGLSSRAGTIRRLARFSGWALMLVIVYVTLSGIEQRPAVGWLGPDIERSVAFLATAAAFAIGYPRQRLLIFAFGLAAVVALEFAQNWMPTRHGTVRDALVKATGLGLGLLLVVFTERLRLPARFS